MISERISLDTIAYLCKLADPRESSAKRKNALAAWISSLSFYAVFFFFLRREKMFFSASNDVKRERTRPCPCTCSSKKNGLLLNEKLLPPICTHIHYNRWLIGPAGLGSCRPKDKPKKKIIIIKFQKCKNYVLV